jgi:hypothetical protein
VLKRRAPSSCYNQIRCNRGSHLYCPRSASAGRKSSRTSPFLIPMPAGAARMQTHSCFRLCAKGVCERSERAAPTLAKCERAANFLSRVTFDPRAASLVSKSNSRLLKSSVCLRRITNWHLCDGSGESWSSRSTPITRRLNMCWLMVFNAVKNYYYKVHQRQCRDCYRRWKNDAVWVFYDAMKNSH